MRSAAVRVCCPARICTVTIRVGHHALTAADPLPADLQEALATITSRADAPSDVGGSDTAGGGVH